MGVTPFRQAAHFYAERNPPECCQKNLGRRTLDTLSLLKARRDFLLPEEGESPAGHCVVREQHRGEVMSSGQQGRACCAKIALLGKDESFRRARDPATLALARNLLLSCCEAA